MYRQACRWWWETAVQLHTQILPINFITVDSGHVQGCDLKFKQIQGKCMLICSHSFFTISDLTVYLKKEEDGLSEILHYSIVI